MSIVLRRPVDGPRIVPRSAPRLPADVLPNGHPGFRVTQGFSDVDAYWLSQHPNATAAQLAKAPRHQALDLGNYYCGDRVLAMAAGTAVTGRDPAGALYVVTDHGGGLVSRLWHLDGWTIREGSSRVVAGQQVGIVGDTGLGAICHLHIEVALRGVKQDPLPLLTATLPDTALPEDDMTIVTITLYPQPITLIFGAGSRVAVYDPAKAAAIGTVAAPAGRSSRAPADAKVVVSHSPQRVPNGTFHRISAGPYAGGLVKVSEVGEEVPVGPAPDSALATKIERALSSAEGTLQGAQATVNALKE